ncbi:MAG: hypothetical protein RLN72_03950, partial [Henriciella sp.]
RGETGAGHEKAGKSADFCPVHSILPLTNGSGHSIPQFFALLSRTRQAENKILNFLQNYRHRYD